MTLPQKHDRSSDSRFSLLIGAITDYAIFMLDPQGIVCSWNPGARRFKGYCADEIIGKHFAVFYTLEDQAAGLPSKVLERAANEGHAEMEGWRVRKDAGRFWAHVVVEPIRDPDGVLLGFAKITRDLTTQHEVAERMRRSEEQFRLLVQGVTDHAIYMLDREGYVTTWNAGAERITGYRRDEIVGKHFSVFHVPRDRLSGVPTECLRAALREGHWEQEGERVRKDGSRFWAEVSIDPIRDETGSVIGFAKLTHDVSERRAAQSALEDAREAMFNSQRIYALGQLTGGTAHDFNNLLAVITGALEMLQDSAVGAQAEHIDAAMNAAERGRALIGQLLSIARGEEPQLQAVDIGAAVRGILNVLTRAVGPAIRVDVRIAPGLPNALVDPSQLNTALLNLVVNARDAMPSGGTLTIRVTPAPGDAVMLKVEDTGIGMDERTLAEATRPFFTTKKPDQGTGLGLAMVHAMAKRSGGALSLKSAPGKGTVVTISLPIARAGSA